MHIKDEVYQYAITLLSIPGLLLIILLLKQNVHLLNHLTIINDFNHIDMYLFIILLPVSMKRYDLKMNSSFFYLLLTILILITTTLFSPLLPYIEDIHYELFQTIYLGYYIGHISLFSCIYSMISTIHITSLSLRNMKDLLNYKFFMITFILIQILVLVYSYHYPLFYEHLSYFQSIILISLILGLLKGARFDGFKAKE